MIERSGRPTRCRRVARVALRRRTDMATRPRLRILWEISTAVTTSALPVQPSVAHHRRRPRDKPLGVT